jgi:hypothetical protein
MSSAVTSSSSESSSSSSSSSGSSEGNDAARVVPVDPIGVQLLLGALAAVRLAICSAGC